MNFNRGGNGKPRGFGFSGFQLKKEKDNQLPPPPSSAISKHGYSTMSAISQNALSATFVLPKKRSKTEEEYFDEDDEQSAPAPPLEYIPAPGSPSYQVSKTESSDSEEDPLDAFMADIEKQVQRETIKEMGKGEKEKGIRGDIEEEDMEESYYRYMEENPLAGIQNDDSDPEIEYDEDGNPIAPKKSKEMDPLAPIDHSEIKYSDFEKNFYTEHEEIMSLSFEQIEELRQKLGIKVTGLQPPNPVCSFVHFGFDETLMKAIRKANYTQPTPIQAQAIPAALGGRDLIGIARTGSGKTAAFIWPMLVHIMDQKELQPGDGPIGLILAPTRELSQQIYTEAKKFGKVYNIQVVCCYGGGSKWEQSRALEDGAEIVVATPGRMIDLVKIKATNLQRVTYLVLDEADRMFDMGFEAQVRSICNHVRPDRQTLLFSATFKKKIERLARDVLTDPIRIVQGDVGEANTDVTQIVIVVPSIAGSKFNWLMNHLVEFQSRGSLLIFVTMKTNAEELANNLKLREVEVLLLHGDMDQTDRNKVITQFKKKVINVLVATDVAARGLDIPHIRTVINYDVARDIDTHTHRIGRTGRAGEKGTAYTLVTDKDKEFAGHLVRNLEGANQEVPNALLDLAMQSSWFHKSRYKSGKGKNVNVGGRGLGYRQKSGSKSSENCSGGAVNVFPKVPRTGPGTDRLSALKAAFLSQYQNQFIASSDHTWEQIRSQPGFLPPSPPSSQSLEQTRCQADFVLPTLPPPRSVQQTSHPPQPSLQETNQCSTQRKKKKSRWDTTEESC